MKTNKLLLCLAAVLVLAFSVAAVSAETASKTYGYYCTSGNCGVNAYNYNYGYSGAYSCPTTNYLAPFRAEFVRDVTYPDGTYVMPGSTFTKTWRIRNAGTQPWNTDTQLVYVAGDPQNAYNVYMPHYVAPGSTVDISVTLTAPTYGATVSGQWMLQAPDGTQFGVGCFGTTPIWVSVKTWTNGACSCLGQPTCNCKGASFRTGTNPYCNNKIRSITDVTYPDGSVVAPGQTFRKIWRMKNGGTCVWTENYLLSFFYGDDLGFDGEVKMWAAGTDENSSYNGSKYQVNRNKPFYIHQDEYVYIAVDLKAPTTPGNYEAYFKLRDNYGYEFGFGSYADAAFWVNVTVANEGKSVQPDTETVSVSAAEEKSAENTIQEIEPTVLENVAVNRCGEQSIALRGTEAGYQVLWTAVNDGTKDWNGYKLVKADGNPALTVTDAEIAVPTTAPGETAEVTFDVAIDSSAATNDALWMEFYMDAGDEGFCEFYFEAPAK